MRNSKRLRTRKNPEHIQAFYIGAPESRTRHQRIMFALRFSSAKYRCKSHPDMEGLLDQFQGLRAIPFLGTLNFFDHFPLSINKQG
jgi:hypothetical protein